TPQTYTLSLHDALPILIGARPLTIGGRNQGNNLHLWKIRFEPIHHFLSCLFGCCVTNDKYIDIMNRGESVLGSFVVSNRYDFMADATEQFSPHLQFVFIIANLKHDPLG